MVRRDNIVPGHQHFTFHLRSLKQSLVIDRNNPIEWINLPHYTFSSEETV